MMRANFECKPTKNEKKNLHGKWHHLIPRNCLFVSSNFPNCWLLLHINSKHWHTGTLRNIFRIKKTRRKWSQKTSQWATFYSGRKCSKQVHFNPVVTAIKTLFKRKPARYVAMGKLILYIFLWLASHWVLLTAQKRVWRILPSWVPTWVLEDFNSWKDWQWSMLCPGPTFDQKRPSQYDTLCIGYT